MQFRSTHKKKSRRPSPINEFEAVIKKLRAGFESHRSSSPRKGTHIPLELRQAVVAAVNQGVPKGVIQQACRLSGGQLAKWRAHGAQVPRLGAEKRQPHARHKDKKASDATQPPHARVFPVVEPPAIQPLASTAQSCEQPLELRLGSWLVRIQLTGS